MIEARVFIDNLDDAKKVLAKEKAQLQGSYKIHDTIYRHRDSNVPLIEEFLRLRVIPENIWDDKAVILAVKRTNLHQVGKDSAIPLRLSFDTRREAENYYTQYLKDTYEKDFDFWRIGWQYFLPNGDVVDLEIVEDTYPTIEFKSETDIGIKKLADTLGINRRKVITGPSVVAIRKILKVNH